MDEESVLIAALDVRQAITEFNAAFAAAEQAQRASEDADRLLREKEKVKCDALGRLHQAILADTAANG